MELTDAESSPKSWPIVPEPVIGTRTTAFRVESWPLPKKRAAPGSTTQLAPS